MSATKKEATTNKRVSSKEEFLAKQKNIASKRRLFFTKIMEAIDIMVMGRKNELEILVFGGAVRDDNFRLSNGFTKWEYGNSDIDIKFNILREPPRKTIKDAVQELFEQFVKLLQFIDCKTKEISNVQKGYNYDHFCLRTLSVEFQGITIEIDLVYGSTIPIDFNVNSLVMSPTQGITVIEGYKLKYFEITKHIRNQTFLVLLSPDHDIKKIVLRIGKMESRGWKCLNFNEIFDFLLLYLSKFNFKKCMLPSLKKFVTNTKIRDQVKNDKDLDNCGICLYKVKSGAIIPTMQCGHNENFHHRCLLSNFLTRTDGNYKCPLCFEPAF